MHDAGSHEALPLVIVNPRAGRTRRSDGHARLLDDVRSAVGPCDVAETGAPRDATRLAAAARAESRPLVVGVGGDGTLSEIVNGLMADRGGGAPAGGGASAGSASGLPALGFVACGTGGDFGRSLDIPRQTEAYLAALRGGVQRTVDVGWARFMGPAGRPAERFWINVLSAGIGGLVDRYTAAAPSFIGGRLAYAQATLRAIVACRRVKLQCRYEAPDGRRLERLLDGHAVAVCNGRFFGGGMTIAPMARLDDGLLEVVAFETRTRWRLIGRFLTVYAGTHVDEPGVNHFTCRSIELRPAEAPAGRRPRAGLFPLDVDGDALGDVPVRIAVLPAALRVIAPPVPHAVA